MPIYIYRCENCGVQFERQQKFSDQPLTRCPECGKKALRKVYQPVGIVFKGSGFYSTDHRSPSGMGRNSGSHKHEAHEGESSKNNTKGNSSTESSKASSSKNTSSESK
jgi:putative FmdB family regulatory protein